jgi:hypothetical protein
MIVTGRKERTRKQILDYLKEKTGYWNLKQKAPDRKLGRTCFGKG